ncbi:hypothetical protein C7M84_010386 [Penaeus vannamei]|uniref:Uncharacterized protein n=1 Tax=Penaeus vannamei TaxID=6689 RepID=A0A423T4B3_PENVA|nr:hypothetical protein C7M84_010386 [Penaeus vannamei]
MIITARPPGLRPRNVNRPASRFPRAGGSSAGGGERRAVVSAGYRGNGHITWSTPFPSCPGPRLSAFRPREEQSLPTSSRTFQSAPPVNSIVSLPCNYPRGASPNSFSSAGTRKRHPDRTPYLSEPRRLSTSAPCPCCICSALSHYRSRSLLCGDYGGPFLLFSVPSSTTALTARRSPLFSPPTFRPSQPFYNSRFFLFFSSRHSSSFCFFLPSPCPDAVPPFLIPLCAPSSTIFSSTLLRAFSYRGSISLTLSNSTISSLPSLIPLGPSCLPSLPSPSVSSPFLRGLAFNHPWKANSQTAFSESAQAAPGQPQLGLVIGFLRYREMKTPCRPCSPDAPQPPSPPPPCSSNQPNPRPPSHSLPLRPSLRSKPPPLPPLPNPPNPYPFPMHHVLLPIPPQSTLFPLLYPPPTQPLFLC